MSAIKGEHRARDQWNDYGNSDKQYIDSSRHLPYSVLLETLQSLRNHGSPSLSLSPLPLPQSPYFLWQWTLLQVREKEKETTTTTSRRERERKRENWVTQATSWHRFHVECSSLGFRIIGLTELLMRWYPLSPSLLLPCSSCFGVLSFSFTALWRSNDENE